MKAGEQLRERYGGPEDKTGHAELHPRLVDGHREGESYSQQSEESAASDYCSILHDSGRVRSRGRASKNLPDFGPASKDMTTGRAGAPVERVQMFPSKPVSCRRRSPSSSDGWLDRSGGCCGLLRFLSLLGSDPTLALASHPSPPPINPSRRSLPDSLPYVPISLGS